MSASVNELSLLYSTTSIHSKIPAEFEKFIGKLNCQELGIDKEACISKVNDMNFKSPEIHDFVTKIVAKSSTIKFTYEPVFTFDYITFNSIVGSCIGTPRGPKYF